MIEEIIGRYENEADRKYLMSNISVLQDALSRSSNCSGAFLMKCCDYLLTAKSDDFKEAMKGWNGTPQSFYIEVWTKNNALTLLGVPSPSEQDVNKLIASYKEFLTNNVFANSCVFDVHGFSNRAISELCKYKVSCENGMIVPDFDDSMQKIPLHEFSMGNSIDSMLRARNLFLLCEDSWYLEMIREVRNKLLYVGNKRNILIEFKVGIPPLLEKLCKQLMEIRYTATVNDNRIIIEW